MSFPQVPFNLNHEPKGDKPLIDYLKNSKNFPYLGDESKNSINKIPNENNNGDLRVPHKELIELWHNILTDVLLELKKKDNREWKDENSKDFFDKKSLGTDELKKVVTGFSEFEGIMYGASPDSYRDHIAHSFRVWILGHGILKECLNSELLTCEDESLKISPTEWQCMWAIVALCHDIGYPLSAIEKINQKARTTLQKQGLKPEGDLSFSFSQQMLPFHDTIIKIIASKPIKVSPKTMFLTHLQNKYYLKLLKSFDNLDHGIISSLLISASLVYFLESDLSHDNWKKLSNEDARQFLIRREILRAISAHTCQDIYHLHFNTLSFLLYIVDEIQCWGRPTFEQLQYGTQNTMEKYVEVKEFYDKQIEVIITTDDNDWDENKIEIVNAQVGKLRKMLRLAVGTNQLKESIIHFEIKNLNGQCSHIKLQNGKIDYKEAQL